MQLVLLDPAGAERILAGHCPAGLTPAPDFPDANDQVAAGMFLERVAAGLDPRPFGVFVITVPAAAQPMAVGGIGFHSPPDPDGAVEIGYDVVASHRRRGLATAAVEKIAAYALTHGAARLLAETEAGNTASLRVLQATGFDVVPAPAEATGQASDQLTAKSPVRLARALS